MRTRTVWLAVALALVLGVLIGVLGTGAWLLGPAGYRPAGLVTTPSSSATSTPPARSPSATANPAIPSARSDAAMGFDAATGNMVLFGGSYANSGSDTWTWDGKRWSRVQLASGPAPRWSANMAYDQVHQVVVMRGGQGAQGAFDDTWTWNGSRWLLMSPVQSAPVWSVGGGNEPLLWDQQRNLVLLYAYTRFTQWGGTDISELNQVWAWDGSTWSQVQTAGSGPMNHGMQQAGFVYDTARHEVVFFGHDNDTRQPRTWVLDGGLWRPASTSGPGDFWFSMTEDESRSSIVFFGATGDTWTWDGARWTAQNPAHSPSPRVGAAMAYDSARHVVDLFGGGTPTNYFGYSSAPVLNDLWTWDGSDWTRAA